MLRYKKSSHRAQNRPFGNRWYDTGCDRSHYIIVHFEWEDIKKIDEKPELLDPPELDGRVIKVISMLLNKMPKQHDYKVIFMQRSVAEVAASQQKMIDRLGIDGAKMELQELERGLSAIDRSLYRNRENK